MMFGKKVTTLEDQLFKLETVSCEDCRFMREDNEEGYICLAHARRRIEPKGKKECQRFLKNALNQKITPIRLDPPIREKSDIFDTKPLYELISGNAS